MFLDKTLPIFVGNLAMQTMSPAGIDLELMLNDFMATSALQPLPTDQAIARDVVVCSACGEKIRKGLVRCSECHAFTRLEIEAAYCDMIAKRQMA